MELKEGSSGSSEVQVRLVLKLVRIYDSLIDIDTPSIEGTPYANGYFNVSFSFAGIDYPNHPPKCKLGPAPSVPAPPLWLISACSPASPDR